METTFLDIKFLIFIGLATVVVTMVGIVLIAGVYQVVRDKVREARRQDEIVLEPSPVPSEAHAPRRPPKEGGPL